MIVTRNQAKEGLLLDALVRSFGMKLPEYVSPAEEQVRGEEIHVSDLLKVRVAYWSRKLPLPPRRDEALNFTTGRAHEEILHRRLPLTLTDWKEGVRRFKHGLQYRPDADWQSKPTEFKTRVRNLAKPGEEPITYDNYLEQIQAYSALDENPEAHLVVLSLAEGMDINNNRVPTHRELAVYDVLFSPGDLEHMRGYLVDQKNALEDARSMGASKLQAMRLCPEWMCGKNKVIEKGRCSDRACDVSHRVEKAGHVMSPNKYVYEARCKWKILCRPELVDPTRQAR